MTICARVKPKYLMSDSGKSVERKKSVMKRTDKNQPRNIIDNVPSCLILFLKNQRTEKSRKPLKKIS